MQQNTVQFYRDKVLLGFQSEQVGHPVFEDRDHIRIIIPGDTSNIIEREATDLDKQNYAGSYAKYKAGLEPSVEGTPIEEWPRMTPAQAANYKALGFKTVEQVAEMADTVKHMGAQADKAAARAYVQLAQDSALPQKLALEIQRKDNEIADLQAQIKELAAKIDDTPRRGRPPKDAQE